MSDAIISSRARLRYAAEALAKSQEDWQWEEFVGSMLAKLELPKDKHEAASRRYDELGRHIARKLDVGDNDVHVVVQGSMRTGTTIAGDGREKFDLDIVVKLCGSRFESLTDSEPFFQDFGKSLIGARDAGPPEEKSRCWRLQYPGEPYYFDVTPAIPMSEEIIGTDLRVRDPRKTWSPSNPEDFAEWFCTIADKRFEFQRQLTLAAEARVQQDKLPTHKVRIDDILRRAVQLIKLHRDAYYKRATDDRKEAKPISVILVTLITKAYDELVTNAASRYGSSAEVVAEIVGKMRDYIEEIDGKYYVFNPALHGTRGENFADRWNTPDGLRRQEFLTWHDQLERDLEALFSESPSQRSEDRVRSIFGERGVSAWKAAQPSAVFGSLLGSVPAQAKNPSQPRSTGSQDKLA